MWVCSEQDPLCTSPNEESGLLANNAPLTGYEPNFFDDFHYSETTEIFLQSRPATRGPRTCMTRRSVTTPSAERSLHHCSLRSASSSIRENPCRYSENEQIRILLERQKERILADCRAEIQKHEFQSDSGRRSIQKLNGINESQRSEINRARAGH